MPIKLDHHHRHTVEQIYGHPIGHNIKWRDVVCLLERFGDVNETHRGGWTCVVGSDSFSFGRIKGRDLSKDQVIRVRHLLQSVGISSDGVVAA